MKMTNLNKSESRLSQFHHHGSTTHSSYPVPVVPSCKVSPAFLIISPSLLTFNAVKMKLTFCPFSLFLFTTTAISFTKAVKRRQRESEQQSSSDQSFVPTCSKNENPTSITSSENPTRQDPTVLLGSCLIEKTPLFVDEFAGCIPFLNTSQVTRNKLHRVLFILGGPGAGKGTQCANMVDTYKCVHLSVGELLRQERLKGDASPHAELIEQCLVLGQIVPVEISLSLVRRAMDEISNNLDHHGDEQKYGQCIFLIDGFPRNYDNLKGWVEQMLQYAVVLGALVYDCPMDVLEQRILGRAETSGRSDDNIASVRKRFDTFQEQTMPIVHALEQVQELSSSYKGMNLLSIEHIAGDRSIAQVWDQTQKVMNAYIQNDVLTANALLLSAVEHQDVEGISSSCNKKIVSLGDIGTAPSETTSAENMTRKNEWNKDDYPRLHKISNPRIVMTDGTKTMISYDRYIYGPNEKKLDSFRETRLWSHEENGWVCVQLSRNPL